MRDARLIPIGFMSAILALAACDDAGIGGDAGDGATSPTRAEYSRELIFVATDATAGALLEFNTADAGTAVRRSARGWAEGGSGWTPLYDVSWEGPAQRRPWRLVPHGPVHLRMGLSEQLEAISIRDAVAETLALETGDFITEWTPSRTSQLVLREATLALGTEPIRGWLVDASFGVAPQVTASGDATLTLGPPMPSANSQRTDSPAPPVTLTPDSASEPLDAAALDSLGRAALDSTAPVSTEPAGARRAAASASAVRALRAVLFTEDGAALVLGDTETGVSGWFWSDEAEHVLPVVTLTAMDDATGGWSLEARGAITLTGRLEGLDEAPAPFAPRMVRGTLDVDGEELEFNGVLRPRDAGE